MTPPLVVAPAHPSLDGAIHRFCDELRAETRYFGRRGAAAPKPTPSLVRRLETPRPALELAAFLDGRIVGVARLEDAPPAGHELLLAVARPWRGRGVAVVLGRQIVALASDAGIDRIVLRTTTRPSARSVGRSASRSSRSVAAGSTWCGRSGR